MEKQHRLAHAGLRFLPATNLAATYAAARLYFQEGAIDAWYDAFIATMALSVLAGLAASAFIFGADAAAQEKRGLAYGLSLTNAVTAIVAMHGAMMLAVLLHGDGGVMDVVTPVIGTAYITGACYVVCYAISGVCGLPARSVGLAVGCQAAVCAAGAHLMN